MKSLLSFMFIVFATVMASAQMTQWAKSFGGDGVDIAWALATDPSDNILLAGESSTWDLKFATGVYASSKYGDQNFFIARMNSSGDAYWAGTTSDWFRNFSNGVAADANGNAHLVGTFTATGICIQGVCTLNTLHLLTRCAGFQSCTKTLEDL